MAVFSFVGISLAVLVCVLLIQYSNWNEALKRLWGIDSLLANNGKSWLGDAKVGDNTVMDRFDRSVAPPLDDIRRFSNAALVTGIGGTMAIFLIEAVIFLIVRPEIEIDPSSPLPPEVIGMIISGAIALLSSLIGVLLHLWISLKILDRAQRSVTEEEENLVNMLKKPLPPPGDINGIKESSDIDDFRKILEGFLKRQDSLNSSMEEAINTISSSIRDAMSSMNSSVGDAMQQQQESAKVIQRSIEELTEELKELPEAILKSFRVNEIFERVAKTYIEELFEIFKEHRGKLNETIIKNQEEVKHWLANQIHTIMEEVIKDIHKTMEKSIIEPLDKMREQLNATTHEIPNAARDFALELQKSAETLSKVSERLEKFPDSINEAVKSTVSETMGPISDELKAQMGDFSKTVEDTHIKLSGTIESLVKLIKDLIREIEIQEKK